MSLNGLMGMGLSSAGTQNPWDAQSAVAVDFRRPERREVGGMVKAGNEPSMPKDYVTLHTGELQVGSAGTGPSRDSGAQFMRTE